MKRLGLTGCPSNTRFDPTHSRVLNTPAPQPLPEQQHPLLQLPSDPLWGIVKHLAWPRYAGANVDSARHILRELAQLRNVHHVLHDKLQPLWKKAHWSFLLARLEDPRTSQAETRTVLKFFRTTCASPTPSATDPWKALLVNEDGDADEDEEITKPRLGVLRMGLAQENPQFGHWFIEELFEAFFLAHPTQCEQGPTGTVKFLVDGLPPLSDLPYRFLGLDLGLNPCLHYGTSDRQSPGSLTRSFNLLLAVERHLGRLDKHTLFFVLLNLHLAHSQLESQDKFYVLRFLRQHREALDDVRTRLESWCKGFLNRDTRVDEIDPLLAQEILDWLIRLPRLDNEAAMRLLMGFCQSARLRQGATDKVLVPLLVRAMNEIDLRFDDLALRRFCLVIQCFPIDLGVAAFKQLSPRRQVALMGPYYGGRIAFYIEALVKATDIPLDQRRAVLQRHIDLVTKDHEQPDMQEIVLPQLQQLLQGLERAG